MTDLQTPTRFRIEEPGSVDVIAQARAEGRALALQLEFPASRVLMVTTVISELARNILTHAKTGEIRVGLCSNGTRSGINIAAWDEGPGIADLNDAMLAGYSSSGDPGLGLPGINRMADDFRIESRTGHTLVRAVFWAGQKG